MMVTGQSYQHIHNITSNNKNILYIFERYAGVMYILLVNFLLEMNRCLFFSPCGRYLIQDT